MAVTSGNFTTSYDTSYNNFSLTFRWSLVSQSVENNTSTISFSVKWETGGSGDYRSVNYDYGYINGQRKDGTTGRITAGGTVASGTVTIPHNDDGTKTFSASWYTQTTTPRDLSGSGSWELPAIDVSKDMNIRIGNNIIKKAYVGTTEVKEVFYGETNIFPGYTRLEYIQSSGSQYINTGIQTNSNNFDKIEFKFKDNSAGSNSEGVYFGSYDGLMLGTPTYNQTAYTFAVATTGSWKTSNPVITPNTNINTYVYNNGSNSINNTVFFNTVVTNSNKDIFLCKVNGYTPSNNKTLNIYSFKISKNNNLIRDFIPVKRKTDNKVGLYDLVEHKFYGNSGSGDFVAGPEI